MKTYDFTTYSVLTEDAINEALTVWVEGFYYDGYFGIWDVERDEELIVERVTGFLLDEVEDGEGAEEYIINADTFANGLGRATEKGAKINSRLLQDIEAFIKDSDACYLDAESTDVVIQFGLFGEIVYG